MQSVVSPSTEIFERLKSAAGYKKDADLARDFCIPPKKFAVQKLRGTIPLEEIITFCRHQGYSLEWALTGQGEMRVQQQVVGAVSEPVIHYSTDRQADVLHHKLQRIIDEGEPGKLEMIKVQLKHLDPGPKKQELSNEQNSVAGVAGNHAA